MALLQYQLQNGVKKGENMPLIKSPSDEARSKNIAKEIEHGKSKEQAAAIAYDIQRKAEHSKPKEMSIAEELGKIIHTKYAQHHKEKPGQYKR